MRRPDEPELSADPIEQFRRWFSEAVDAKLHEPNACALATASGRGRPSARMVLLKTFDDAGFVLATNYESRKADQLAANPWASLVFYWSTLERQVRIEGSMAKSTPEESDRIYTSRPRGARLGAWVSRQSRVIPDRDTLERGLREMDRKYPEEVPRPPFWGGYRLTPNRIELWGGRAHRLHDRFCYRLEADGSWTLERLAP